MIVKVCGMREAENIRQVEQTGADWMGFIDYEGSPRYVPGVPEYLPETVQKVGVFVNASLSQIRERVATWQLDYVQLPGKTLAIPFREVERNPIARVLPGSATDRYTRHQGLLPAYA